jgi:hypothetical protein
MASNDRCCLNGVLVLFQIPKAAIARCPLAKCRSHAYALPDISVHRCLGENP